MWYSAALFFQGVRNGAPDDIWELEVILLQAESEADITAEAQQVGKDSEHEYKTVTGDQLRWVCRHVEHVYELIEQDIKHGAEVYSQFLRERQVTSLLHGFNVDDEEEGAE